jgi:hypothetical protein
MADCDYRRGLLARNAAVIAMRSDCDERRQPFDRDGLAKHRARLRHDATNALSGAGTPLAQPLARESRSKRAMSNAASMSINPLFLRHDLMIELGRLEMAIDDVRLHQPAANESLVCELETKCARINEALAKLPA